MEDDVDVDAAETLMKASFSLDLGFRTAHADIPISRDVSASIQEGVDICRTLPVLLTNQAKSKLVSDEWSL